MNTYKLKNLSPPEWEPSETTARVRVRILSTQDRFSLLFNNAQSRTTIAHRIAGWTAVALGSSNRSGSDSVKAELQCSLIVSKDTLLLYFERRPFSYQHKANRF